MDVPERERRESGPPAAGMSSRQSHLLTGNTVTAAQLVLRGERRGPRAALPFVGPAVVASVAYIDPGNFATNIAGGSRFGYELLWVVVMANLIAMLFQAMAARLGIATGRNLAELCRAHTPRPVTYAMWVVSEIGAMATDLAEFLGASVGLTLLFGLPLLASMTVTGIVTYAVLSLERHGFRPLELVVGALVGVIALCYVAEMIIARPDWGEVAYHSLVPHLSGAEALTVAVGIVGATVMPHAIYLHSGLTQGRIPPRDAAARWRLIRFSNREVVVALAVAGLVNMAMLTMAARVFHDGTHDSITEIDQAYQTLAPLLGGGAAVIFLVSLLASGFSSSVVGTLAGQMIMQGFVGFRIPLWLRRLLTMLPAFAVVASGVNPTRALVLSQVVLSLVLPVPMVALVVLSARRDVMGEYRLPPWLTACAAAAAVVVLSLNVVLLLEQAGVPVLPAAEAG